MNADQSADLSIAFLIENCQFSFQINPTVYSHKLMLSCQTCETCTIFTESSLATTTEARRTLAALGNFIQQYFQLHNVSSASFVQVECRELNMLNGLGFPADHLSIRLRRSPESAAALVKFKSAASLNRNKDGFRHQKISILLFRCGKITITGTQTVEDLNCIFLIMEAVVNFFFQISDEPLFE